MFGNFNRYNQASTTNQYQNTQQPYFPNNQNQYNMPNFQNPVQATTPQIKVLSVSTIDEAKNYILLDNNPHLFTDFSNNNIYLKLLNQNGQSEFYMFSKTEIVNPNNVENSVEYVSKSEFEEFKNQLLPKKNEKSEVKK